MSRAGSAHGQKPSAADQQLRTAGTVVLPSFPKFEMEKVPDRKKWCSDYDKVEGDLLKNHLGMESVTLGLRCAPQEFDRRLPSLDDPTQADRVEAMRLATRGRPPAAALAAVGGRAASTEPRSSSFAIASSLHHPKGEDGASSFGGVSPIRKSRTERALSPVNVTRCMTAVDHTFNSTTTNVGMSRCISPGIMSSTSFSSGGGGGGDPLKSLSKIARILDALLHPPSSFQNSFRINLQGVDLSWMWHYAADRAPPQLLTLDTLREQGGGGGKGIVLSSPRSTVVMLRNGVTTEDLVRRPLADFQDPTLLPGAAELNHQYYEERRRAMLTSLRQEYRDVCSAIPLHDLVSALVSKHKTHLQNERDRASPLRQRKSGGASSSHDDLDTSAAAGEGEGGFVAQHKAKLERLAFRSKEKLRKQIEAIEAFKKEMQETERRQQQAEKELHERAEDRKRHLEGKSQNAAQHFASMKNKVSLFNVTHLAKMEEKRQKMEAKAEAKREALQLRARQERQEAEARAAEKRSRFEQSRANLASNLEEENRRRLEKEALVAERHAALLKRQDQEREAAELAAQKAAAQRKEAITRVRQLEEKELQKALEREQQAEERLKAFHESQRAARIAAAENEIAKEEQRKKAIRTAEMKAKEHVQQISDKRREHDLTIIQLAEQRRAADQHSQEVSHLITDDKRYLVQRQAKSNEFRKLLQAVTLLEKEDQVAAAVSQKKALMEHAAKERELLRLEKERLSAKLAFAL